MPHTHIAMVPIMHLDAGDAEKVVPAVRERRVPEDQHREDEHRQDGRAQQHHWQRDRQRVLQHVVDCVRVHGAQRQGGREAVVLAVDGAVQRGGVVQQAVHVVEEDFTEEAAQETMHDEFDGGR